MAVVNGYVDLDRLERALGGQVPQTADLDLEAIIESASRQIDEFCGRHFWVTADPEPREFTPLTHSVVLTDDFTDADDVTVHVDAGSGTWVPLAAPYWRVKPSTPRQGRPFDRIAAVSGHAFGCFDSSVQVTAKWGWPAVPKEVTQACLTLAIDQWKSKDMTGGVAGFGEFGAVRLAAFNSQARALLQPFKDPSAP